MTIIVRIPKILVLKIQEGFFSDTVKLSWILNFNGVNGGPVYGKNLKISLINQIRCVYDYYDMHYNACLTKWNELQVSSLSS